MQNTIGLLSLDFLISSTTLNTCKPLYPEILDTALSYTYKKKKFISSGFDIDEDASVQDYILDIEIKNLVNDDVITHKKTVEVSVDLPKKNSPWKLVGGAVVLIVLIVYRYFDNLILYLFYGHGQH